MASTACDIRASVIAVSFVHIHLSRSQSTDASALGHMYVSRNRPGDSLSYDGATSVSLAFKSEHDMVLNSRQQTQAITLRKF